MARIIRYGPFVRAIILIAVGACCAPALRAQDCSRNMLTINGPNSYVATPGVAALNLTKGFTIECWANVSSVTAGAALVDKASYGIFLENDSTIYGMVRHSTPLVDSAPTIDSPADWHHFAFTFTPGDSIRFYIDTMEVSSAPAPMPLLDSNTDSLRIGMSISGSSFIGSIDELRIWNTPRTNAAIVQTLTHTIPGTDSGLVLYYSFDDPAGTTRIHDFSGHGHDGFIRGTNAEIVPSSSPMLNASPGYQLATVEKSISIATLRCFPSFDTVLHIRNLGPVPIYVDTVGFHLGIAFSVVPNVPFWLPADSSVTEPLQLHFEPNAGGVFDDSLYVASSSICGGRLVIGLHAVYDSVGLLCSPDTLNFGSFTQCQLPTTRKITLTNTSVTDSVTILELLPPGDTGLHVFATFPILLGPAQDTSLTVELSNGNRGQLTAAVGFQLDKCSRQAIVSIAAIRSLAALSMPDSINFGSFPSTVQGFSRDTTIIVTNIGDVPNAISAIGVAPDSLLDILDNRIGVFKLPGDTLQVRVRMHDTACGLVVAGLKIKSYECRVDTATTLFLTLTPPPVLTAAAVNMGVSCARRDTTIVVSNPGDYAAHLDTIVFSQNFIFKNEAPFPMTIPAHDSIPVQVRFDPVADTTFSDTAYLAMSPCGTGIAILKGQLGFHGLAFNEPQLLFGRGCKTDSITEQDTLTNLTSETVIFGANTYAGSPRFSVVPLSFPVVLPPGGSKAIAVTYAPTLGALDTGTFSFLSLDGCTAASFHLRGSREIGQAIWVNDSGEFDTLCPGASVSRTFILKDVGFDSIDVMSVSTSGAGFTVMPHPATFANNGSFTVGFSPTHYGDHFGILTIVVDSCGTSFSLPLHGIGGPEPSIALSDTAITFDSLRVGDSASYCISIANPSCQPISVHIDLTGPAGTPYKISQLPNTNPLVNGDTAHLCVQFTPVKHGIFTAFIYIAGDSISTRKIALTGVGLAPDVQFSPSVRDFGYVLTNSSKTMMIYDSNAGNLGTAIAAFHDQAVFVVQPPDALAPLMADSIAVTFNPMAGTGLVYDTLRLLWDGHADTVILRGYGTQKGLQLSAVGLDFGNVHVGTDSTLPLYLFATNDFPTIDSISVIYATPVPNDTFADMASRLLPYAIQNDRDTLTVEVTYHARHLQLDTDYLVIHFGANFAVVSLTATGVEALPSSNPDTLEFLGIILDSTEFQQVRIKNSGGYPLYINSISVSDPAFVASPILPTEPIAPGETRYDTVTFTPIRTRQVIANLGFHTSYHDSVLNVLLIGSGTYSPKTGPSFSYSIPDRVEEPGQNDSIPVTMNGIRLSMITDDSLVLDIRFDPLMVMMYGADAGTNAQPVSRFTHIDDSTVEASLPMTTYNGGTVMRIYTQALLGPHPISYIHVVNSAPAADQPESSTDGRFTVEDCGGLINGVEYAGPYSTNAIVPNPAGDNISLTFEIGWEAPVMLDIYNAIGQTVRHIDMGTLNTGQHTRALDISDLPQGRYVYRLKSLDYHAEGALVVLR